MKEQHGAMKWADIEMIPHPCKHGHDWHPTIIIGYFQCSRCPDLAACRVCVRKMRGAPLVGVCQQHQHVSTPDVEREEVLA